MAGGSLVADEVCIVGDKHPDGWASMNGLVFRWLGAKPKPADTHKDLWLRLRCELQLMQTKGARHLDPVFLMRFMDYPEMVEESK